MGLRDRGQNFLLTILRLATQREELKIVRDQIGAPTRNGEIAKATTKILAQICDAERGPIPMADVSGIYHMTAGGETTWFDFTNAILQRAAKTPPACPWFAAATSGLPLITQRVLPITPVNIPRPRNAPLIPSSPTLD